MKNKKVFWLIILLMTMVTMNAEAKTYVFKTNLPSGAMPIKMDINGDTYWFITGNERYSIELSGNINYYCEDAYGQSLTIETSPMDDGTVNAYVGGMLVRWANHGKRRIREYKNGSIIEYTNSNESDYSYESPDYSYSTEDSGSNYYEEKFGNPEEIAEKTTDIIKSGIGGIGTAISSGDKQLVIRGGFGRAWGTYGRFEARFGDAVAFSVYGGAGKDLVWNLDNKDKLSWHAGLGVVFPLDSYEGLNSASDISLGLTYGETPAYVNKALLLELGCDFFFGKSHRFGIFGSAGFGLGNFNEGIKEWFYEDRKYVWDVTAGLVIRI